jgi:hypothetical protein
VVRGAPVTVRETRGVASAVVARSSAPGVKDVAALAGVSPSTVSNYLNRPDVVRQPGDPIDVLKPAGYHQSYTIATLQALE